MQFTTKYGKGSRVYVLTITDEDPDNCSSCGQKIYRKEKPGIIVGDVEEVTAHLNNEGEILISYMIAGPLGLVADWHHRFEEEVYPDYSSAEKALRAREI